MRSSAIFAEASRGGESLHGAEANVLPVPGHEHPRRIWLGTDGAQHPAAYLEVVGHQALNFSVSQVISVQTVTVQEATNSDQVTTAKVTCHEPRLAEVFYSFIDEVLARISPEHGAVDVITAASVEWRNLLQVATSGLTEPAAAGLFGELCFLEALLEEAGPIGLEYWQRSARDIHDFIGPRARVEVKTSAFQNRSAVTVHGLRQLEPPQATTLTLAVADVQKHGEETLDAMVDRILDHHVDREQFLRKLADAGYVRGMPGSEDFSFSLLSWRFWEIDEQSAVLRRSALAVEVADAVSNLTYALNLGALGDGAGVFEYARLIEGSQT